VVTRHAAEMKLVNGCCTVSSWDREEDQAECCTAETVDVSTVVKDDLVLNRTKQPPPSDSSSGAISPEDGHRTCEPYRIVSPSVLFLVVLSVAATAALLIVDSAAAGFWDSTNYSTRCEDSRGRERHLLRQRANSMSNLAFFVAGCYAFLCALFDFRHPNASKAVGCGLVAHPSLSIMYGVALVFTGVGSFWYHACSGCREGGKLDVMSIFIMAQTVLSLIIYAMVFSAKQGAIVNGDSTVHVETPSDDADGNKEPPPDDGEQQAAEGSTIDAWVRGVLCFWVVGCCILSQWETLLFQPLGSWQNMYYLIIAFLLLITGLIVALKRQQPPDSVQWPYAVAILFPGVVGVCAWAPEELFKTCVGDSQSAFQLHALWHVMMALTLLAIFVHIRSLGACKQRPGDLRARLLLADENGTR